MFKNGVWWCPHCKYGCPVKVPNKDYGKAYDFIWMTIEHMEREFV